MVCFFLLLDAELLLLDGACFSATGAAVLVAPGAAAALVVGAAMGVVGAAIGVGAAAVLGAALDEVLDFLAFPEDEPAQGSNGRKRKQSLVSEYPLSPSFSNKKA